MSSVCADAAGPILSSDDEEDFGCLCCLSNFETFACENRIMDKWLQCPEGHLLCEVCYDRVGGETSACPTCNNILGKNRCRLAENVIRKIHHQMKKSVESSEPCKENILGNDRQKVPPQSKLSSGHHRAKDKAGFSLQSIFRPRGERAVLNPVDLDNAFKGPVQHEGSRPSGIFARD
jgi:hypothetical protein